MQRIVITLVLIVVVIAAWLLGRDATVTSESAVVVAPQQVDVPVEALQTPAIDVERAPSEAEPEARDELATEEAVPALPPLPSLEVRAVTPSGVPVAGVEISLYPAEPDERAIAEPLWRARQSGVTNGSGIVRFETVSANRWGVAPTPAKFGQPGSLSDPTLAPGVEYVTLARGDGLVAVELVLHRELWITGRVLDPDHTVVSDAHVISILLGREGYAAKVTDDDGRFELGPLVAGHYELTLLFMGEDGWAPPEPVYVEAGTHDVELVVRRGGQLRLRLIDSTSGEAVAGEVFLIGPAGQDGRSTSGGTDKTRIVNGIVAGRYHVTGRHADLIGTARDVLISAGEVVDLDIPLVPAGKLRVSYRGPRGRASYKILHSGVIVKSDGVRSESSNTATVPFGELEVVFTVWLDGWDAEREKRPSEEHRRTVVVTPGESASVHLDLGD